MGRRRDVTQPPGPCRFILETELGVFLEALELLAQLLILELQLLDLPGHLPHLRFELRQAHDHIGFVLGARRKSLKGARHPGENCNQCHRTHHG